MFRLLSFLCFVRGTATFGQFWRFVSLCISEGEGRLGSSNLLFVTVVWWFGTSGQAVLHACDKRVIVTESSPRYTP